MLVSNGTGLHDLYQVKLFFSYDVPSYFPFSQRVRQERLFSLAIKYSWR